MGCRDIGAGQELHGHDVQMPTYARFSKTKALNRAVVERLCAEVGDFARFPKPALLSGFLGVVPSEYTSDEKRTQGQITKAGPANARRLLAEAANHAC